MSKYDNESFFGLQNDTQSDFDSFGAVQVSTPKCCANVAKIATVYCAHDQTEAVPNYAANESLINLHSNQTAGKQADPGMSDSQLDLEESYSAFARSQLPCADAQKETDTDDAKTIAACLDRDDFFAITPIDNGVRDFLPLDWDEVTDQSPFLDSDHSRSKREVERVDFVSPRTRAAQVAREFANKHGLDESFEELIFEAFVEWGWGQTQAALIRRLADSLTEDELRLAIHLRRLWADDDAMWCSAGPWEQKALSWEGAVGIVRSFNAYPDLEELEVWLHDARALWGETIQLRFAYPTFHIFIFAIVRSNLNCLSVSPGIGIQVELGSYQNFEYCENYEDHR